MNKSAARDALDRIGRTVDLTNYTDVSASGSDYGETWKATSGSPTQVTARVVRARRPNREPSAREVAYFTGDVDIYVKDTVSGIRDGGGDGASKIEDGDDTFYVIDQVDQDNGLYQLRCERSM